MIELDRFDDQKILLALLRERRGRAGLRQVDVAELLGAPQSFVSKYEAGERQLDFLEVYQLCRIFGVTMLEFVAEFEEKRRLWRINES